MTKFTKLLILVLSIGILHTIEYNHGVDSHQQWIEQQTNGPGF